MERSTRSSLRRKCTVTIPATEDSQQHHQHHERSSTYRLRGHCDCDKKIDGVTTTGPCGSSTSSVTDIKAKSISGCESVGGSDCSSEAETNPVSCKRLRVEATSQAQSILLADNEDSPSCTPPSKNKQTSSASLKDSTVPSLTAASKKLDEILVTVPDSNPSDNSQCSGPNIKDGGVNLESFVNSRNISDSDTGNELIERLNKLPSATTINSYSSTRAVEDFSDNPPKSEPNVSHGLESLVSTSSVGKHKVELNVLPLKTLKTRGLTKRLSSQQQKQYSVSVKTEKTEVKPEPVSDTEDWSMVPCEQNNVNEFNSNVSSYLSAEAPEPVIVASPRPSSPVSRSTPTGERSQSCVVDTEKSNIAPMLLMNNLPYMGELTFDTRPRRGRKPKKADICHLISKNYGIQFPISYTNYPNTTPLPAKTSGANRTGSDQGKGNKTTWNLKVNQQRSHLPPDLRPAPLTSPSQCIQTPLIDNGKSNLHKNGSKSTANQFSGLGRSVHGSFQSTKSSCMISTSSSRHSETSARRNDDTTFTSLEDEPLNLCVRDSSRSFHSPSGTGHSKLPGTNVQKAKSLLDSKGKAMDQPINMPICNLNLKVGTGARGSKTVFPSNNNALSVRNLNMSKNPKSESTHSSNDANLVNPLGLQLNLNRQLSGLSHLNYSQHDSDCTVPSGKRVVRRKRSTNFSSVPSSATSSSIPGVMQGRYAGAKRICHQTPQTMSIGIKNSSTANTEDNRPMSHKGPGQGAEVSICKFKFTGGAKPSLQEKKMLSVDSGGNFRFYTDKVAHSSGKGIRNSSGSTTNAGGNGGQELELDCQYAMSSLPKSAKSMSMCMPMPVTSMMSLSTLPVTPITSIALPLAPKGSSGAHGNSGLYSLISRNSMSPEDLLSPPDGHLRLESPHHDGHNQQMDRSDFQPDDDDYSSSDNSSSHGPLDLLGHDSPDNCTSSFSSKMKLKRKRRTRKSLMREKLEKTFKEKGFLIQTQQLESAEGATYCKFRQLRKFTRYLFRSWKDYLPDNVKEINNANNANGTHRSVAEETPDTCNQVASPPLISSRSSTNVKKRPSSDDASTLSETGTLENTLRRTGNESLSGGQQSLASKRTSHTFRRRKIAQKGVDSVQRKQKSVKATGNKVGRLKKNNVETEDLTIEHSVESPNSSTEGENKSDTMVENDPTTEDDSSSRGTNEAKSESLH